MIDNNFLFLPLGVNHSHLLVMDQLCFIVHSAVRLDPLDHRALRVRDQCNRRFPLIVPWLPTTTRIHQWWQQRLVALLPEAVRAVYLPTATCHPSIRLRSPHASLLVSLPQTSSSMLSCHRNPVWALDPVLESNWSIIPMLVELVFGITGPTWLLNSSSNSSNNSSSNNNNSSSNNNNSSSNNNNNSSSNNSNNSSSNNSSNSSSNSSSNNSSSNNSSSNNSSTCTLTL